MYETALKRETKEKLAKKAGVYTAKILVGGVRIISEIEKKGSK